MTQPEYIQSISDLANEYDLKKKDIAKKFALSNNKHNVGEILTDHIGSIIIDKIMVGYNSMLAPECIYEGKEVRKDGVRFKKNTIRKIWQQNII